MLSPNQNQTRTYPTRHTIPLKQNSTSGVYGDHTSIQSYIAIQDREFNRIGIKNLIDDLIRAGGIGGRVMDLI